MSDNKYCCYLCVTPFHIFNAITLNEQLGIKADLFIMDMIPDAEGYVERIKKENIFNDVILLSRKKMWDNSIGRKTMYLAALNGYFKIKRMIRTHMPRIDEYTDVFIPCMDIPGRYIYCYKKKYNDNIKIHIFDDGIGAYSKACYELTKFDKIARTLFVGKKTISKDYDIYIYSPEFYNLLNADDVKIHKISILNESMKSIVKRIFRVNDDCEIKEKYIVFDMVRVEEPFSDGGNHYSDIIEGLIKSHNDIIIKPHPRDRKKRFDCRYYNYYEIPFEVLCYFIDFSDKVLISINSTACFTPKIIYNEEPKIVFLYNGLKEYYSYFEEPVGKLIYILKDIYNQKENVIIPHDVKEIIKTMEEI